MQLDNEIKNLSCKETIWNGLTLTDAAVQQMRHLIKKDADMLGLRLTVKQSGCAGFSYIIRKAMQFEDNDLVYGCDGVKLYVSQKDMPFVDGTEIDYVKEGLNCSFKFNNPKVQHICGCGESFGF